MKPPDRDELWVFLRAAAAGRNLSCGLDFCVLAATAEGLPGAGWVVMFRPQLVDPFVVQDRTWNQLAAGEHVRVPTILVGHDDPADEVLRVAETAIVLMRDAEGRWISGATFEVIEPGPLAVTPAPLVTLVHREEIPGPARLPGTVELDLTAGPFLGVRALDRRGEPAGEVSWYRIEGEAGAPVAEVQLRLQPAWGRPDGIAVDPVRGQRQDCPRPSERRRRVPAGAAMTVFLVFDRTTVDPVHWHDAAEALSRGEVPAPNEVREWNAQLRGRVADGVAAGCAPAGLDPERTDIVVVAFCDDVSGQSPLARELPRHEAVVVSPARRAARFGARDLSLAGGYYPGVDLCDDVGGALDEVWRSAQRLAHFSAVLVVSDSPPHFDGPPSDPLWAATAAPGARVTVRRRDPAWRRSLMKLAELEVPVAWVWPMVAHELVRGRVDFERAAGLARSALGALRAVRPPFRHIVSCAPDQVDEEVARALDELVYAPPDGFARPRRR